MYKYAMRRGAEGGPAGQKDRSIAPFRMTTYRSRVILSEAKDLYKLYTIAWR